MDAAPNSDELLGLERLPAPPPSEAFDTCRAWIEQLASEVVQGVLLRRAIWDGLRQIWEIRDLPPSPIFDFIAGNYADAQAVAVRRLVESGAQSRSLRRVLSKLAHDPDLLSRERLVGAYAWGSQHLGHAWFDAIAGPDADRVPHEVIAADLLALERACEPVSRYVNKTVAHLDRHGPELVPTFGELDLALDAIGEVFGRWYTALTGKSLSALVPTPQYDWAEPLRVPWLGPDDPTPMLG